MRAKVTYNDREPTYIEVESPEELGLSAQFALQDGVAYLTQQGSVTVGPNLQAITEHVEGFPFVESIELDDMSGFVEEHTENAREISA